MSRVVDEDVAWIRSGTAVGGTIRSAVPAGYEVYGVLDLSKEDGATEDVLLDALAPAVDDELVAGWIDRGPWMPPSGDDHVLYTGWRYRFRRATPAELRGLPAEGEGSFPDMLFPKDRSWFVSLLWDDCWRSIGSSRSTVERIERRLPSFERIAPNVDISSTGREVN